VGYALAVVAVGLATMASVMLVSVLGPGLPLTLFVLAVAAAAWLGGVGPGLLATLASVVIIHVLSTRQPLRLPTTPAGHSVHLLLFALVGCAVALMNEKRRSATTRAADATAQSERQGAELVRSEARFRRIVETAQEGIWNIDAAGHTVYANRRLAEMLGYKPEELLGGNAFDLVAAEDLAAARAAWAQPQTAAEARLDLRFRHRDGATVWLRAAATTLFEAGQFTGAFAMLTDITETRRREAALRASDARRATRLAVAEVLAQATHLDEGLRRILEIAGDGLHWCFGAFWLVDREANALRCAQVWMKPGPLLDEFAAATRRITFSPGVGLPGRVWTSLEGAWIGDIEHDANFPRQAVARTAGLRSGFAFPLTLGRECLGVLEFFSDVPRALDRDLLASFLDVGSQVGQFMQRIRIEEERQGLLESEQEARREAEAANRSKDEFLATLSHELRTPLNAIVGWSHLLRTGQLDEAQRERAVEVIDRNAKTQAQIVADVLDVSKIVMGKLRLEVRPVELAGVIGEALDTLRPAAAAKDIAIDTLLAAGHRVSGDPDRLQQVVWNLVSNAIKFTPNGGRIRVVLRGANGCAEMEVADTGPGIRPDFLPHVFERFRQSDSSSTRAYGGLGLGLALVRHLVELHGGTVTATSAGVEGEGATFLIRLPRTGIKVAGDGGDTHEALPSREGGRSELRSPTPKASVETAEGEARKGN
jgi:PAS domain S-box-containing protein